MNLLAAVMAFVIFGGALLVLRPVAAAFAKRIAGEHRPAGMDREERDEILTELQQVRREVAELGERVDFTERLLAKQRDPDRLARGGGGGER
jgi:hypothetical protein